MAQLHELFTNQDSGKDLAYPIFYEKTIENTKLTLKEGKAQFEVKEYVTIKTFDKTMEYDGPVEEKHKRRWPSHYKAFKEGLELPLEGTPIQHWPVITDLRRKELNSVGIRTVEELAEFPDGNIPPRSDYLNLKRLARDWLQESKGLGILSSIKEELKQTKSENESLKETVDTMSAKIKVLEEMVNPTPTHMSVSVPVKKKRGRPRKNP